MRGQVSCEYNIGAARLKVEPAFLSELDAEGIFLRLKEKVENGLRLTDEELMEFRIFIMAHFDFTQVALRNACLICQIVYRIAFGCP